MTIVQRATNICLTPQTEWPVIAQEPANTQNLITGYVVPLAAIGSVAGFVGGTLIGHTVPFLGTYRVPLLAGLSLAIFTFVMAIVGIFVLSFIINALAPNFGGQQNSDMALKVAVYSYTPAWIAGVLRIVPALGLLGLLAALYGLYLLYLGLPRLMKCPEDKAVGYTAVVVLCAIVLSIVIGAVGAVVGGAGMIGAGGFGGTIGGTRPATSSSGTEFAKDSLGGKLQEMSRKLEENNKKMEAAQKNGDANGQVTAAMESLGVILGGGKRVEPISVDELKPFVPESFAGLPRRSSNFERNGIAGLMIAKAEANYSDGAGRNVKLEISDTGGVSGLVGLAGWAGLQGEKEDENGAERTRKVNGRLVHEKVTKRGGRNAYGIVLGDRFIVNAEGTGVEMDQIRAATQELSLDKLEAMKATGVANR